MLYSGDLIGSTIRKLRTERKKTQDELSGLAGIAHWINIHYKLKEDQALNKHSELVIRLKEWVDNEYANGRVTVMTDNELVKKIDEVGAELGITVKEGEVVTA